MVADYGTKRAMSAPARRRPRPPLSRSSLEELALRYVGRFATTRAKLKTYLRGKIRERGWDESAPADLDAIGERFAAQGYVDDAAFALARSRSLSARGFGKRRLMQTLRVAGVGEGDDQAARAHADEEAVNAALRFAERRRLGPFSSAPMDDPKTGERALAAMIRAGHAFSLARAVLALPRGCQPDPLELSEFAGDHGP